jgi:hypothetical protein
MEFTLLAIAFLLLSKEADNDFGAFCLTVLAGVFVGAGIMTADWHSVLF